MASTQTQSATTISQSRIRLRLGAHESILGIILIVALVAMALLSDQFFTIDNLLNQARLMSEVSLLALPMTYVIITGGIDLSA